MLRQIALLLLALTGPAWAADVESEPESPPRPNSETDTDSQQEIAARATDPLSQAPGSWGLAALGLSEPQRHQLRQQTLAEVTVALINTGVDYSHPELPARRLWRNPDEQADGLDNDGNGLVDDLIGWNFVDHSNQPWDDNGSGTHLAGIIAAQGGNGIGIEGVAPNVRLMVLKALDGSGAGRGSHLAAAIRYATAQGATIIHLGAITAPMGALEQQAIEAALAADRLVVMAAPDQAAADTASRYDDHPGLIRVGAMNAEGETRVRRAAGAGLLAPGVDILSLRARGSDLRRRLGEAGYRPRSAVVDQHYYLASGNATAASYVTGAAALMLGYTPQLTGSQLATQLIGSSDARAVIAEGAPSAPRVLNLTRLLPGAPQYQLQSELLSLEWKPGEGFLLYGRCAADAFGGAQLHWGAGESPRQWQLLTEFEQPPSGPLLTTLSPGQFPPGELVTLRLTTHHQNGQSEQSQMRLRLGADQVKAMKEAVHGAQ